MSEPDDAERYPTLSDSPPTYRAVTGWSWLRTGGASSAWAAVGRATVSSTRASAVAARVRIRLRSTVRG